MLQIPTDGTFDLHRNCDSALSLSFAIPSDHDLFLPGFTVASRFFFGSTSLTLPFISATELGCRAHVLIRVRGLIQTDYDHIKVKTILSRVGYSWSSTAIESTAAVAIAVAFQ